MLVLFRSCLQLRMAGYYRSCSPISVLLCRTSCGEPYSRRKSGSNRIVVPPSKVSINGSIEEEPASKWNSFIFYPPLVCSALIRIVSWLVGWLVAPNEKKAETKRS